MVNGGLVGAFGVGNRNPRLGQNAGRDRAQSRPDRRFGSQGVFFGHKRFYGAVHVVSMGWFMTLRRKIGGRLHFHYARALAT